MHRFFVKPEQIGEREIRILGGDVNHISHVLRMRPGDELCVCDGDKMEYTSRILEISPEEIRVEILYGQEQGLELPCRVTLFQGLPKGDKMELIVQKAVELGAWEIVPMATRRAVVKLDRKKEEAKLRRWQGIAESAAKQAKRMRIPEVCPVMTFAQAATNWPRICPPPGRFWRAYGQASGWGFSLARREASTQRRWSWLVPMGLPPSPWESGFCARRRRALPCCLS